ncbi:MAG: ATP-dependent helicase HrpB [Granulosicoccus sp.]
MVALANEIADALPEANVLLAAQPGAGKSTGLPLALLLNGNLPGKIIVLEPRRLAARSVAQRLALHLGEKVGQRVGLRMRAETRVSANTQLTVVTEGVLTRLLQEDPSLEGVALVIFDEFHERSLHADLGLALCLEVQQALRDDLRLLLMSATLDTDQLQTQLRDVQQFRCSVRQFPVDIIWVGEQSKPLAQRVVQTVLTAIGEREGDVLVFLPGVAEINRTASLLEPRLDNTTEVHRLHSGIALKAQLKATCPATNQIRRVILATSLAETSLTIDGVRIVIDSGVERRGRIDGSTGAQRLETVMASQASATQRAGRAGRTSAGTCYRLWSESGHSRRPSQWQPEIHRADLAPLLLQLGLWGASSDSNLPWLDAPPTASLARAEALLTRLGLWKQGQLTARGRTVAALPVHPRHGHMLLWAAERGSAALACHLTVLLEEQTRGRDTVDLEPLLNQSLPSSLQSRADSLNRLLITERAQTNAPSAAVVLAQAYPDWIAQRRSGEPGRFALACGAGVTINTEDSLAHCQWLSAAQLGGADNQLRIFKGLQLNIEELERYSPQLFVNQRHIDWDQRQQRVLAENRILLGKLTVESGPLRNLSGSDKAKALLAGIQQQSIECLPWSDNCREWQARVQRMHALQNSAQSSDWPLVDDATLIATLEHWLLPWLDGLGSIKALQQLDLYKVLNAMLDYRQQALLDQWLPLRYTVPSGSTIKLSYVKPGNPVLSVRLQEMLGCAENPTIAQGKIPLTVELLSPARRPVQVTTDLANFWSNSYPAVKKDMAGRYPKHSWPDDPLTAKATSHAKRRKR